MPTRLESFHDSKLNGLKFNDQDFEKWGPEKFGKWMDLCSKFINQETGKWTWKQDNYEIVMNEYSTADDEDFHEFLERLYKPKVAAFKMRLMIYNLAVCEYLKYHPDLVVPAIRAQAKIYKQFSDAVAEITDIAPITGSTPIIKPEVAQSVDGADQMRTTVKKVVSLIEQIADRISENDIKRLKGIQKFAAIQKLLPVLNYADKKGPVNPVFNQMNFIKANPQDLEKMFDQYTNTNQFPEEGDK